jgi:hypothetical protein
MSSNKPTIPAEPQPQRAWWCRTENLLFAQGLLLLALLRLVLYSYTAVDPAEREPTGPFIAKFAALIVALVCLGGQAAMI